MKKTTYIFEQNCKYYYRRRLNKKTIFTISLKTDSLTAAKRIADIISYRLKDIFSGYLSVTHNEELEYINKIVSNYVQEAIKEYSELEYKRHEACKIGNMDGAHPEAIKREHDKIDSALYSTDINDVFNDVFKRTGIKKSSIDRLSENAQRNFKYILLKKELDILKEDCNRSIEYLKPIATLEPQRAISSQTVAQSVQERQTANYYSKTMRELRETFLETKRSEKVKDISEYVSVTDMFLKFCEKEHLIDIIIPQEIYTTFSKS